MKNIYDINDWMDITQTQMIGEILMQAGIMSLKHLDTALSIQKIKKIPIGEILVEMKVLSHEQLAVALDLQQKINDRFN